MRLPQFTIRDLIWFTVVMAVLALLWSERIAIKKDRASLKEQIAAERAALNKDAAKMAELNRRLNASKRLMESDIEYRARVLARQYERPPSADELEASKRASVELGAPQPKPLPPGYGDRVN